MTLRADLCALLQLDPERATDDDVLDLVGGLLDEANGYDGDTATDVSRETWAPSGGGTPPRVYFEHPMPDRLTASPPGARIRCDLLQDGASSLVTIRTIDGDHIAEVTVHAPLGEDTTTETLAIASALYWSWWRAQDMRGTLGQDR